MSIQRGQIYFVNLNPVKGREQSGQRPALVISTDRINELPLVVTVIVGTKGANLSRDYSTNVRVSIEESGLPLETVFLGFQVRSLDASRFSQKPAGVISNSKMIEIENAVRFCLDLWEYPCSLQNLGSQLFHLVALHPVEGNCFNCFAA